MDASRWDSDRVWRGDGATDQQSIRMLGVSLGHSRATAAKTLDSLRPSTDGPRSAKGCVTFSAPTRIPSVPAQEAEWVSPVHDPNVWKCFFFSLSLEHLLVSATKLRNTRAFP